jgi:hypothetical protein
MMILVYYLIRRDFSFIVEEYELSEFTPAKYTIELNNIPSKGICENDIKEHFEILFGKVHEVSLVRDY